MEARLTTKPERDVIAAIQALDLESVKVRVMDAELGEGWTREYAESIEAAYKTYLTMLVKHQDCAEEIMLSKDVDEFWHTHILQTMKYADDCQQVFGTFLHHNPHIGERTAADLEQRTAMAEKTRSLYEREFGSAQHANAAWSGQAIKPERAAYSTASIHPLGAAYSSAAIRANQAAYSSAAIRSDEAAYSSASIDVHDSAYSSAAIRSANAAYSSASIRQQNGAYSSAAINSEKAAYSSASIRARDAAYSSAAIQAKNAAYSSAAIEPAASGARAIAIRVD
jgi:hypothetical protein